MRGVDKVAVFVVVCGGAALSASCLLPIDELLEGASRPDGGAGTTGEATDSASASTGASSGGAAGGSSPTTTSTGGGTGGSLPMTCIAGACPSLGCVVEDGANSEGPKNVSAMVVSGSALFWMSTSGNKVWRRQLDQSSATLFAQGLSAPTSIAVSADDLFFADELGIWWCSLQETDCTAHKKLLINPLPSPPTTATVRGLTVLQTELYWALDASPDAVGSVEFCSIADKLNCKTTRAVVASNQVHPQRVAIDPSTTDVLWTSNGLSANGGNVSRAPKGGGVKIIASGRSFPVGIALMSPAGGSTRVFWSEGVQQAPPTFSGVYTCLLDNGVCSAPLTIMDEVSSTLKASLPFDLALDSQRLYWANSGAAEVLSCALPCTNKVMKILADGLRNPHAVVVHEPSNCVFWADDEHGGRVLRQARP